MKRCLSCLLLLLIGLLAGCGPYQRAQVQLTGQIRKGIDLCRRQSDQHQALITRLHDLRQAQLEQAFIEDVQQREAHFTAQWIIDHCRAYVAARQAIDAEQSTLLAANDAHIRTLAAMDAAAQRLQWLQQLSASFLTANNQPEEMP